MTKLVYNYTRKTTERSINSIRETCIIHSVMEDLFMCYQTEQLQKAYKTKSSTISFVQVCNYTLRWWGFLSQTAPVYFIINI